MDNKIPEFSEKVVSDFKLKYLNGLKIVEIYPDEEAVKPYQFLIKKPSKALVYMLSSKEFEGNIEKSSNAMVTNCVLAGDLSVLEDDASLFTELVTSIGNLMKGARSELKKA